MTPQEKRSKLKKAIKMLNRINRKLEWLYQQHLNARSKS